MKPQPGHVSFQLPYATRSQNQYMRAHWRDKRKWAKDTKREVYWRTEGQRPKSPFIRSRITVTRRSRGRLDHDNFVGGCKALIDALQYAGVILDDTPDHVQIEYVQEPTKGRPPQTTVEVVEVLGSG